MNDTKLLVAASPVIQLARLLKEYGWECNNMDRIAPGTWRECRRCNDCKIRKLIEEILENN